MYQVIINRTSHALEMGSLTGAEIKKLGNIPSDHVIKFQIPGRSDLIEISDNDFVDLTRPGAEHFISEKPIKFKE